MGGSSNQDSTFASVINNGLSLFGVFDGHGENGARVSSFVAQRLPFEVARLGRPLHAHENQTKKSFPGDTLQSINYRCAKYVWILIKKT